MWAHPVPARFAALSRIHTPETIAALLQTWSRGPRERGWLSASLSEATDIVQVGTLCRCHTKLGDFGPRGRVVPGGAAWSCSSSFPPLTSPLSAALPPGSVRHTLTACGGGVRGVTCPIKSPNPLSVSQRLTILGTIVSSYSRLETDARGF